MAKKNSLSSAAAAANLSLTDGAAALDGTSTDGAPAKKKPIEKRPHHDIAGFKTGDDARSVILRVYVLGEGELTVDDLEQAKIAVQSTLRKIDRMIAAKEAPAPVSA